MKLKEGSFIFINNTKERKEEFIVVTDSLINSKSLKEFYERKHKRLNKFKEHKNIKIKASIIPLMEDSLSSNGIYYFQTELIDFPNKIVHARGMSVLSYWVFIKVDGQLTFQPKVGYMNYISSLTEIFGGEQVKKFHKELESGVIYF